MTPTRILILGATGILGQHLRITQPTSLVAYARRTPDAWHLSGDLTDWGSGYPNPRIGILEALLPHVVVNLSGENRVDVVERDPDVHWQLNVEVPTAIAGWCASQCRRYVHISSQAVFSGEHPPYGPMSEDFHPVNAYGRQKLEAERVVRKGRGWTIVRPTTVLGVRPFVAWGRENPLEAMCRVLTQVQVADRWWSPCLAREAAQDLWRIILGPETTETIIHLGRGVRTSRYKVASAVQDLLKELGWEFCTGPPYRARSLQPVLHDELGLAQRPADTTWNAEAWPTWGGTGSWEDALRLEVATWIDQQRQGPWQRAAELAGFLSMPHRAALAYLETGFAVHHQAVAEDFHRSAPATDDALLDWYRGTRAYLWELSAYHLDPGFNYAGLLAGIVCRLAHEGLSTVLCLGDGIGGLTLALAEAGLTPIYHDLAESRTADFATFRFDTRLAKRPATLFTHGWEPALGHGFDPPWVDAVVALDFFEHLTDVRAWAVAVADVLKPHGLLFAQNAFGIGSPDREGTIPCHLAINTVYETEWAPMLKELGFDDEGDGWWRKRVSP